MRTTFFDTIYFPMTCDLIHPGHIKSIKYLEARCKKLIIGLLTEQALRGYKQAITSYEDRAFLLCALKGKFVVVAQDNLNPEKNIKKYHPNAIASGDGWEKEELEIIKKYKLTVVDIDIPKEHSSTAIKKKVCQSVCY